MKKLIIALSLFCLLSCGGGGNKSSSSNNLQTAILGDWYYYDGCLSMITFYDDQSYGIISFEKMIIGGWTLNQEANLSLVVETDNGGIDCWGDSKNDTGRVSSSKITIANDTLTFISSGMKFVREHILLP